MSELYVIYGQPRDTTAFTQYYLENHLPLAAQLPDLTDMDYALGLRTPEGRQTETFGIFRAEFADIEALPNSLQSSIGQQVAADVPNYADGGASVLVASSGERAERRRAVAEYLDAWNAHDVEGIVGCLSADGVYTDPGSNGEISGQELRNHLQAVFSAVPDLRLDIMTIHADRTTGTAFWRGRGADGALDFFGADLLKFDDAGKVTWTTALYDQQLFKEQLTSGS